MSFDNIIISAHAAPDWLDENASRQNHRQRHDGGLKKYARYCSTYRIALVVLNYNNR